MENRCCKGRREESRCCKGRREESRCGKGRREESKCCRGRREEVESRCCKVQSKVCVVKRVLGQNHGRVLS